MGRAVEELGPTGRTVLLIHGLGVTADVLAGTAAALAERHRVVPAELRGHGRSPAAPPGALDDYAADLVPLLEQHAPAALAGLSFGALVASDLWRLVPEAVTGVVLFDPALDARELVAWAAAEAGRRGIGVEDALFEPYLVRDEPALLELLARYPLTRELDARGCAVVARATLACDERVLRATLPLLRRAAPPARPPGADAPLTLLRARDGIVCPPAAAAAFAAEHRARVIELPCGHQAPLTAPRLLASAIAHALD